MSRCKHGIEETYCTLCNPALNRFQRNEQLQRICRKPTSLGKKNQVDSLVVIHAKKDHWTFQNLDEYTKIVHIHGHPFVWLIKKILEKAPNVRKIQLIPKMMPKLNESHFQLCQNNGIEIVYGHAQPHSIWNFNHMCGREEYNIQHKFFQNLNGEQKKKFDELLYFGFDSAEMAQEYFLAESDSLPTQQEIAEQYGYKTNQGVNYKIQAITKYLYPDFICGKMAQQHALVLCEKVGRLKEQSWRETAQRELIMKVGSATLPQGIPLCRISMYQKILDAYTNGTVQHILKSYPSCLKVILLRFGFDAKHSPYRTLQEVGNLMDLTRERIRQLEERALKLLKIESSDF